MLKIRFFISSIRSFWESKPLTIILFLAILVRLLSVIFAKGWGMLDDHFLVIEVAQSWADGFDVNKWLPWTVGNKGPEGHSFLYVGLHYFLFNFLNAIGLNNPQGKMYVVRLLHATWSLLVVYYGYKITLTFSNLSTAKITGLLLASFWFMPWTSVRNLVEIAAIPLLVWGTWVLVSANEKKHPLLQILFSGLIIGFAFSIRYQVGIYAAGIGLALLIQREFKNTILFGLGVIASILLIQGGIDLFIWGRPFAEMGEYIQYNIDNKYNFIQGGWYNYFLLILGMLLPPISLFLFFGAFYNPQKRWVLFLPVIFFIAFHAYFPNKQERFILTILPSFIICGSIGWHAFLENSIWWKKHALLYRNLWIWFWVLNTVLLFTLSTMYSKKSRVEAMYSLYKYKNITEIMVENTNAEKVDILPQFYAGQKIVSVDISQNKPLDSFKNKMGVIEENSRFVLFVGDNNLDQRIKNISKIYKNLVFETTAKPGNLDQLMYKLNPSKNTNQTIYIYRNRKFYPDKMSGE